MCVLHYLFNCIHLHWKSKRNENTAGLLTEEQRQISGSSRLTFRPCPSQHPQRLWSLRTRQKRSPEGCVPPRRSEEARSSWRRAPAHPSPRHCPGHPRTPYSPGNCVTSKTSRSCDLEELQKLKPSHSFQHQRLFLEKGRLIFDSHFTHFAHKHTSNSDWIKTNSWDGKKSFQQTILRVNSRVRRRLYRRTVCKCSNVHSCILVS